MFWGKEVKNVRFTVNDISSYAQNVHNASGRADECYQAVSSWADKIVVALGEIIEVGTHNLEVCRAQIEACDECENAAQSKIDALTDLINQVEKQMYALDESISKANDAYRKACEVETRISNSTARNEQEEKIRSENLKAAHKAVKQCSEHLSKLREKRSRLYNAKNELGGDINDLNKALSELSYIHSQLNQEEQRISRAVDNAGDLLDKVRRSLDNLRTSYRTDISETLFRCEKAANTALNRARVVEDKMGELNGKSYSDYDEICVTDINAFKNMSNRMSEQINDMTKRFGDIYKICDSHGEKLGDNIMTHALTVMQSISKTEKLYLKQMSDTSVKLTEFYKSLDSYYGSKM